MVNRTLPNGWEWSTLSDCADILDGRREPINSGEREKRIAGKKQSELFPYYGATGHVGWIDDYIFDEEIVLLGEDGAPFIDSTKNKAYVVRGKSWVNNHAHVLRAKSGIATNLFLMHYLNIFDYHEYVTGTTRLKLNQGRMRVMPVPLPPLPVQESIVNRIEELLSDWDAGVAALERVRVGLKRYKASVLKAAVEGKLFENREVENSDDLPEGWRRTTWQEISPRVTVGYVGKMKDEYVEDGVPFLRGQNVRENRFDPEGLMYVSQKFHKQIAKSTLNPGDIVVVRSGAVGVSCVIPDTLPEANCSDLVIIKKPSEMIPEFGAYYLNSLAKKYVIEKKVGVALIHFNTKSVAQMPIPLPPLDEQRRIVAEVERRLSVVGEVESAVEVGLVRAGRLRQSVLRSAFEGRL